MDLTLLFLLAHESPFKFNQPIFLHFFFALQGKGFNFPVKLLQSFLLDLAIAGTVAFVDSEARVPADRSVIYYYYLLFIIYFYEN
jgi:hypothetical protein